MVQAFPPVYSQIVRVSFHLWKNYEVFLRLVVINFQFFSSHLNSLIARECRSESHSRKKQAISTFLRAYFLILLIFWNFFQHFHNFEFEFESRKIWWPSDSGAFPELQFTSTLFQLNFIWVPTFNWNFRQSSSLSDLQNFFPNVSASAILCVFTAQNSKYDWTLSQAEACVWEEDDTENEIWRESVFLVRVALDCSTLTDRQQSVIETKLCVAVANMRKKKGKYLKWCTNTM
jgi:hypothetical protein